MGYIIDKESWLKSELIEIRSLTYAIEACIDETRIPQNLQDITEISQRARRRFIETVINPHLIKSR